VQLTETTILHKEVDHLTTTISSQTKRKIRSRKSIQRGGVYTVSEAHRLIAEKKAKEEKLCAEREVRASKKLQRMEAEMERKKGVDARRAERARKKALLQLQRSGAPIPGQLLVPIPDPDVERKKQEEQAEQLANQDEESDGFIAFPLSEEEEEEEDNIDPALFSWEL
jgi:hypothetical protein